MVKASLETSSVVATRSILSFAPFSRVAARVTAPITRPRREKELDFMHLSLSSLLREYDRGFPRPDSNQNSLCEGSNRLIIYRWRSGGKWVFAVLSAKH